MEIIRIPMNDNSPSKNILYGKSIGQHCQIGFAAAAEQRRQISRMARMKLPIGIVMTARGRKTFTRAHGTLMNMERENSCGAPGQSIHGRSHQDPIPFLIELYHTGNP